MSDPVENSVIANEWGLWAINTASAFPPSDAEGSLTTPVKLRKEEKLEDITVPRSPFFAADDDEDDFPAVSSSFPAPGTLDYGAPMSAGTDSSSTFNLSSEVDVVSSTTSIHCINEYDSSDFSSEGISNDNTPRPPSECLSETESTASLSSDSGYPVPSNYPCPACKCLIDVSSISFYNHVSSCAATQTKPVSGTQTKQSVKAIRSCIQHLDRTQCLNMMHLLKRLVGHSGLSLPASDSARTPPVESEPEVTAAEESVLCLLFSQPLSAAESSYIDSMNSPAVSYITGPIVNEHGIPQPIAIHRPHEEITFTMNVQEHDDMQTPVKTTKSAPSSPGFTSMVVALGNSAMPDLDVEVLEPTSSIPSTAANNFSSPSPFPSSSSPSSSPSPSPSPPSSSSSTMGTIDEDAAVDVVSIFPAKPPRNRTAKQPSTQHYAFVSQIPMVTPPQSPHLANLRNLDTPPIPSGRQAAAQKAVTLKLAQSPPSKVMASANEAPAAAAADTDVDGDAKVNSVYNPEESQTSLKGSDSELTSHSKRKRRTIFDFVHFNSGAREAKVQKVV